MYSLIGLNQLQAAHGLSSVLVLHKCLCDNYSPGRGEDLNCSQMLVCVTNLPRDSQNNTQSFSLQLFTCDTARGALS